MKRHSAEELMPFSPEEWRGTEEAFVRRCNSLAKSLALPTNDSEIDFSNVRFVEIAPPSKWWTLPISS